MSEGNTVPVIIRTPVYLNDPEFFCNKSWTISFNFNTKSWVSFHSYIPNFYIAENNFFYSGINGCCTEIDGQADMEALVGEMQKVIPTTTTTTSYFPPIPTTTSTTTVLDYSLAGVVVETSCELEGDGIITVPPTTTTTLCPKPSGLYEIILAIGYIDDLVAPGVYVDTTLSLSDVCLSIPTLEDYYLNNTPTTTVFTINGALQTFNIYGFPEVGDTIYTGLNEPGCGVVADGWYTSLRGDFQDYVYHVVNGIVVDIDSCSCGTIITTTTIQPVVNECCNTIVGANDSLYVINQDLSIVDLNVHGYTSSVGIAISNTLLWSIDNVEIKEWNITLHPFTSIFNRTISLPVGFSINSGILALDYNILLAISDVNSPQEVIEIEVAGTSAVVTVMFTLPSDRIAISNPLYTIDGKLIVVNQDSITSDYYISQYNYATATLEIDSNIGTIEANILYNCDCNIYVIDTLGDLYLVTNNGAIALKFISNIGDPFEVGSQIMACVTNSLNEITTTTTTTASPTTTTTTTIP